MWLDVLVNIYSAFFYNSIAMNDFARVHLFGSLCLNGNGKSEIINSSLQM